MEDSRAHNPEVAGSNPVPATQIIKKEKRNNANYRNDETI